MSPDDWPTPLPRPGHESDESADPDSAAFAPPEPQGSQTLLVPETASGPAADDPAADDPAVSKQPTVGPPVGTSWWRRITPLNWIAGVLLAGWLVVMPFVSGVTDLRQNTQLVVMVLAVLGVNIATGYGGMISLGHGVFVAVGSFGAAYAVDNLALPWAFSILIGAAVAGVAGALVGLPALRIKGIHLALVTLGLAIAFQPIAKRFPAFSGGVSGRAVRAELNPPTWFGTSRWAEGFYRYLICLAIVVLAMWLTYNLIHSRPGRAMRALRDNDTAAAVYGVNLVPTRVATFAFSASLAGLAGALSIVLVPFTSQESFPFQESLVLYATAVLGGLGSLWGSVLGVAIREIFAWFGELVGGITGLGPISEVFGLLDEENFVFGAVLILLTFVFPRGLAGAFARRRGRTDHISAER